MSSELILHGWLLFFGMFFALLGVFTFITLILKKLNEYFDFFRLFQSVLRVIGIHLD